MDVRLVEVHADNWRSCSALRVTEEQRRWVADATHYLCLCTYGGTWHPLAIQLENDVVGFLMWGVDEDHSRWIGGLLVDAARRQRGVGRAAVIEAIQLLIAQPDCASIALSCHPANHAARSRYAALGFSDAGETAEDGAELVSRLRLDDAQAVVNIEGPREP